MAHRGLTGPTGWLVVLAVAVGLAPAAAIPAAPDDEHVGLQWGLDMVNAAQAWPTATGAGVRVAVLDSGIEFEHPDLAGKVVDGTAFIGCDTTPEGCGTGHLSDSANPGAHGTFVAGIIAANTDNGIGIAGVAPDAQLLSINGRGPGGGYNRQDVIAGIRWAIAHGAAVVNLSLGGFEDFNWLVGGSEDSAYRDVLRDARAKDVVVVAIAHNGAVGGCVEPALIEGALCVTAVGPDGTPSWYSNRAFQEVDDVVAAPGGVSGPEIVGVAGCELNIISTLATVANELYCPGQLPGYGFNAGTSFAAPHVAGVAALLAEQCRSADEIVRVLKETAHNPVTDARGEWDPLYGYGVVDAAAAVAQPVLERRMERRPGVVDDPCIDPPAAESR